MADLENNKKFYYLNIHSTNNIVTVAECSSVEVGYLQVWYTICTWTVFCSNPTKLPDPQLACEDYMKDIFSTNLYYRSFTEYMVIN